MLKFITKLSSNLVYFVQKQSKYVILVSLKVQFRPYLHKNEFWMYRTRDITYIKAMEEKSLRICGNFWQKSGCIKDGSTTKDFCQDLNNCESISSLLLWYHCIFNYFNFLHEKYRIKWISQVIWWSHRNISILHKT